MTEDQIKSIFEHIEAASGAANDLEYSAGVARQKIDALRAKLKEFTDD